MKPNWRVKRYEATEFSGKSADTADLPARQNPSDSAGTQRNEGDDRDHLEYGEPKFDFAIFGNAEQVGQGQQSRHADRKHPRLYLRKPAIEHHSGGNRLEGNHQYPETPI